MPLGSCCAICCISRKRTVPRSSAGSTLPLQSSRISSLGLGLGECGTSPCPRTPVSLRQEHGGVCRELPARLGVCRELPARLPGAGPRPWETHSCLLGRWELRIRAGSTPLHLAFRLPGRGQQIKCLFQPPLLPACPVPPLDPRAPCTP